MVGHATDRIRVRMFYTDPTEATALPTNATIWWGCGVGCQGPATVTSGEWSNPITLTVGDQTLGLYASITNWYPYEGTRWNIRTTRAAAFTPDSVSALTLVDGNATGGNVSLNASATPFLFTGIANAADDTININAVFASGTTTATVALGAASPSTPVTVTSGVNTPVPISSGMNEIAVTHTDGPTTTTYTLRITRSWPISGYEIINADDSTVLASKTGAGFDPADQDDTLVVGHATDRIRVRMFYTDPTEATALPTNATIWWGCGVGCSGPASVTSGEWSTPITLRVGAQTLGLYASIPNWRYELEHPHHPRSSFHPRHRVRADARRWECDGRVGGVECVGDTFLYSPVSLMLPMTRSTSTRCLLQVLQPPRLPSDRPVLRLRSQSFPCCRHFRPDLPRV